jgi:hypothetical protein
MRFVLGILVGIALTIGAAYMLDRTGTSEAAAGPAAERQQMVNWDVVSRNWEELSARIRQEWSRLTG